MARTLLIGWDAADWAVIRPLIDQGKMPALARFLERGSSGNIATLHPVLSPMLWSSIATGKRPYKHGVLGFTEPTPDQTGVRPVTNLSRKTKAVWNILNQSDLTPIVVGWWPSSPAEPVRGCMVSNHYQRAPRARMKDGSPEIRWPMAPGTVHPDRLAQPLEEFRFHPMELTAEHLLPFLPNLRDMNLEDERVVMLAKTLAETVSIQGAATSLMQLEPWDFMAVYFDGIDHFCHGFMKYHPPRRPWIDETDFENYKGVVEAAYRFHDMILGTLLTLAGDDVNVILMSDHGFRSDHLRPRRIPAEPAGPAAEHRDFGILAMAGPGIEQGRPIHGANLLDVCPTILALHGLPIGEDMDGKPLVTVLKSPEVTTIPSWDDVEGDAGTHDPDTRIDPTVEAEAMKQLVELGYVEPPSDDADTAVRECVRELRFHLAQAYMDGRRHAEAADILEELWAEWPREHRFATHLIACHGSLGERDRRRAAIDRLETLVAQHREEAKGELEALRPELDEYLKQDETGRTIPRKLQFKARALEALAAPKDSTLLWLHATQAIAEGRTEDAIPRLEALANIDHGNPDLHAHVGWAYSRMRRFEDASRAFRRALELDPEHADATLGLASALGGLGQWEEVVDTALRATELVYFNPRAHTLLGRALIRIGEPEHAERALHVALHQAPRSADAHRTLAALYTRHMNRPEEGRRHREAARRARIDSGIDESMVRAARRMDVTPGTGASSATRTSTVASPDERDADVITVVSGLPRSGTSMMMQMLVAGGLTPFTDEKRGADDSNPKGYYEHEGVMRLQRDQSWVPDARGRVVKVVAPLLAFLPKDERYDIIFMCRDLDEVTRSQTSMLERLGRTGASLSPEQLRAAFESQVDKARALIETSPNIRAVFIDYASTVADPTSATTTLAAFIPEFDATTATNAVDPTLRREVAT